MKKLFILIIMIISAMFVQNCNSDFDINGDFDINKEMSDFTAYLSIDKSDFDFGRDWDNLSEIDKNTFNLAQKRMNFTFDENGICTTKWTSSSQVNMSDELFDCFINMIALTNEATNDLSEIQWINTPRLKSGSESGSESGGSSNRSKNCVVQSLVYVLQKFGVYSGPYGLPSIDNWINTNNYYSYNSWYGIWA
jgi:hypothetical protein